MSSGEAVRNPIFARVYDRVSGRAEDAGQREHRRELLEGLSGRVVEVGAGNGLNFAHYPAAVGEVLAVEPEPFLRERARTAAASAPVAVRVLDGTAERLPLDDASVDAAVVSLVLCTVPDQAAALAELRRVLVPGGELRFYEHVRSERTGFARFQRVADLLWPHIAGGCHTARDSGRAIEVAGFRIERCRRLTFRPCSVIAPIAPHVLGRARRR
ncbi:MAG: probable methyltransferase [uncultured Solirubrobacterales bacterium]|uniref:Probable methyltransferase n=1 Tax=uncultured Solirubrobacterales bacterium TaxID=768556 RepID=A0A6J4SK55_9ACTN|nr:MAG: probable methyltransferase [uncultured Solirubrobacterales bacterium]